MTSTVPVGQHGSTTCMEAWPGRPAAISRMKGKKYASVSHFPLVNLRTRYIESLANRPRKRTIPTMRTIAIVNEKGGTAKTTTTVNLSAALGATGKRILLVDLDGQAAASRWLGVNNDSRLADALRSGRGLSPILNVLPGVSLAPGCGQLDAAAHELRPTQGRQLHRVLANVRGFDYVLIDCPPSLGNRLIGNALLASEYALVPVETSILALDSLRTLLDTLDDVRGDLGHDIQLVGVVACRFDARTRLSGNVVQELHRALPGKVFNTVIRENVRLRECPAAGESILTFAPNSHGAEDYRTLALELEKRL